MNQKPTYEELEKKIAELEYELKSTKKYGLVWDKEDTKEDVVLQCENNIPVLIQDKSKKIVLDEGENNILIEGDNYHALTALNFIAKESIDVIYIDPPYNTGHEDFIYNDNYVDCEDGYRHSKWLNFINKRLSLARSLLSNSGIIFISIDDNELADLLLLCNQTFGNSNMISVVPRVIKKGGKSTDKIAKNHDYLLIYAKNKELVNLGKIFVEDDENKLEKDEYYSERGPYRLNQCLDYDSLQYNESMDYEISINGEKFYAGGSQDKWKERHNGNHKKIDWVWRWSKHLFEWGLKNGFIVIKNGKRRRIYTKTYKNAKIIKDGDTYKIISTLNTRAYDSLFFIENRFSNDNAKKELDRFQLTKKFDYPKPKSLILELLLMANNKNAKVLDFFAGSGTTGQAVMELNKEDGGHRRFILCTNNENGICENVTYPRLKTVITGIRPDGSKYSDGLPNNLFYFKTDFVKDENNTEQARYCLVEKVDGLLCIAENIYEEVERNDYSSHYKSNNNHLFIFNDYYSKEKFDEFKQRILNSKGKKIVYIYSSDNNIDNTLIIDENVTIKPIPSKIYEIYKEIVEGIKRGE